MSSQLTGPMPANPSSWLKSPKSWLYISLNMLPIATGGTRIGTIISVRNTPLPRVIAPTSSASARPSTISTATATATKSSVLTTVACRPGSVSSDSQFCRGVNDQISSPLLNRIVDTLIRSRLTIGYSVSAAKISTAGSRLQWRNVRLSQTKAGDPGGSGIGA
jgi:hypothetical protein